MTPSRQRMRAEVFESLVDAITEGVDLVADVLRVRGYLYEVKKLKCFLLLVNKWPFGTEAVPQRVQRQLPHNMIESDL